MSSKATEENGPACPPRPAGTPRGVSHRAWPRGTPGACPQSFPHPGEEEDVVGTAGVVGGRALLGGRLLARLGACSRVH